MSAHIAALVRHGDYHQLANVPSAQQPFALTDEGHGVAVTIIEPDGQVIGISRDHPCKKVFELT
jgi:hypothetical protein